MNPRQNFLNQLGSMLIKPIIQPISDASNNLTRQNAEIDKKYGNTKGDLGKSVSSSIEKTGNLVKNTIGNPRTLAEAASFAVPFGKGAGVITKALLPGAAVGGLQELSTKNPTPQSVVGAGAMGAAGAGVMHGIGSAVGKMAGGAEKAGTKFLQSQYSVKPSTAAKIDMPTAISKLADYGHTNLNEITNAADKVTGRDGVITKMTRDAIAKANPVNLGEVALEGSSPKPGIFQVAHNLINDPVNSQLPESQATKIAKNITDAISNTQGGTVTADPLKAYDYMRSLESAAAQLKNSTDEGAKATARVYKGIAQDLEERIFNQSGADKAMINQVLPKMDMINQLHQVSPKLAQDVAGAKTVGELRSLAAPYVQGSQLARETMQRTGNKVISLPQVLELLTTVGTGNPLPAMLAGLETNAGKNMVGNTLRGVGKGLEAIPSNPAVSGQIGSRLPLLPVQSNQEENSQNQQSNQHNQGISHPIANVNGQNQNTIPDQLGEQSGVINPYSFKDQSGQPLAMSDVEYSKQIAALNAEKDDPANQVYPNKERLQEKIDTLNTKHDLGKQLEKPYTETSYLTKLSDYATKQVGLADPSILQLNDTFEKLSKVQNGSYSKLANAIKALETQSGVNIFTPGMSPQVVSGNLQLANQIIQSRYNSLLNAYTGGTQSSSQPAKQQGMPAPTPQGLPPIDQGSILPPPKIKML